MDKYRELADNIRKIMGDGGVTVSTGIVKSVSGIVCEIEVGRITVPDVRLRASETEDDGELLLVPKVGSAVVFGSLTGDLSQLVVLQVDHVESIKATGSITINGGKLGGMVNIGDLTTKINELVQSFNTHTHTGNMGSPTSPPMVQAKTFNKSDYEDTKIKH